MNYCFFLPLALLLKFAAAREPFPKDEAFDDPSQETFQPYLMDLVIYSAGAGIGLLVPFCLFMSCCWLGNCCRNRKKKVEPQAGGEEGESKKKQKGSFKSYLSTSFSLISAFVAIAFGIYGTSGDAATSTVDILSGTEDFLAGTAGLLCKDSESIHGCNSGLGGFLSDANSSFISFCDETIVFIEDVRGILDQINDTRIQIDELGVVVETMSDVAHNIADNVTDANQRLDAITAVISNNGLSFGSSLPDSNNFPDVQDSDLESLQEAIYGVGNASLTVQEMWDETNQTLHEALDPMENSLDGQGDSSNDDRISVLDILGDLIDQMSDLTSSVFDTKDTVGDVTTDVDSNKDSYVSYVTAFFFFPAIILLLTMTCMMSCCKKGGRAPLFGNMCFNYIFIIPYCILPGFLLLFALINEDICDVHMDMLVDQLNDTTINFGSSKATLGQTVRNILECEGTEDLVTLMHMNNELNITDDLSSTLDSLNEAVDGLSSATDSLNGTMDSMEQMIDALNVDFISSSDLSAVKSDVVSLLASLPDENANLDNSDQQDKFTNMYSIDWTAYQSLIDDVNDIITAMSPSNPLGGKVGFSNASTYDQDYFASDGDFSCSGGCSGQSTDSGTYTYGNSDTYSTLDTAAAAMDVNTAVVDAAVTYNNYIVANLTIVLKDINNINASSILFPELQEDASNEYDDIDVALGTIGDGIDISAVNEEIYDIIDQVMNANTYTQCAFIGTYYTGTYLGSYCDDLIPSLITLGYLMVGNALAMFVTFCVTGYFAPYRRKDKSVTGTGEGTGEYSYDNDIELASMPNGNDAPPGFSRKL
jgi:hypothetical protein